MEYIDVDLIVRTRSLAEIDKEIKFASVMIEEPTYDKEYWAYRLDKFELARDISEFCFMNNIPTCDLSKNEPTPKNYRLTELIDKVRELDAEMQEHFKASRQRRKNYV